MQYCGNINELMNCYSYINDISISNVFYFSNLVIIFCNEYVYYECINYIYY